MPFEINELHGTREPVPGPDAVVDPALYARGVAALGSFASAVNPTLLAVELGLDPTTDDGIMAAAEVQYRMYAEGLVGRPEKEEAGSWSEIFLGRY